MVFGRRLFLAMLLAVVLLPACPQDEQQQAATAAADTAPATGPAPSRPVTPAAAGTDELAGNWDAQVRGRLLEMVARVKTAPGQPVPLAVFDFDNTCIRGDLGRAFYDHMIKTAGFHFDDQVWQAFPEGQRQAIRQAWQALQKLPADKRAGSPQLALARKLMHTAYWSLCRDPDANKCYPWQVRFYAGYTPVQLQRLASQVFAAELQRPLASEMIRTGPDDRGPAITASGIRVVPEIKALIGLLEKKGFEVWIVTAGPQWVVAGAASSLGVSPEKVIGMRTRLQEGKLTTEIEPPPTFRAGKVEAIKKFIGRKPLLAVGDSWTDAEMLDYAKHALLIDRGYADLKKKAQQAGWWIQPAFAVK